MPLQNAGGQILDTVHDDVNATVVQSAAQRPQEDPLHAKDSGRPDCGELLCRVDRDSLESGAR